jgi:hypothetical protein
VLWDNIAASLSVLQCPFLLTAFAVFRAELSPCIALGRRYAVDINAPWHYNLAEASIISISGEFTSVAFVYPAIIYINIPNLAIDPVYWGHRPLRLLSGALFYFLYYFNEYLFITWPLSF